LGKILKLVLKFWRELVRLHICMSAACSRKIAQCLLAAWLLLCFSKCWYAGRGERTDWLTEQAFGSFPSSWIPALKCWNCLWSQGILSQILPLKTLYSDSKTSRFSFTSDRTAVQGGPLPP